MKKKQNVFCFGEAYRLRKLMLTIEGCQRHTRFLDFIVVANTFPLSENCKDMHAVRIKSPCKMNQYHRIIKDQNRIAQQMHKNGTHIHIQIYTFKRR